MEYSEKALQKVVKDRLLIDQVDLWLFEEIKPFLGQRVLEVGCGMGNIARYLVDRDLYIGIDIGAKNVDYVNEQFDNLENVKALLCDVTSENFLELAEFEINTIFSLNVFEHIEDHLRAIENVSQVLKKDGYFLLGVPAHAWLYGSMDRSIGHYRRYEKEQTQVWLAGAGMKVVQQKYVNAAGALGWFINGRLRQQVTPPSDQLVLMNKVVPWVRRFESVVPVPFGITLLSVARKL